MATKVVKKKAGGTKKTVSVKKAKTTTKVKAKAAPKAKAKVKVKATIDAAKLAAGSRAPNFKLLNEDGRAIDLASFKGKPIVLYFYPKDNTPGCTQQACDFRDRHSAFTKAGAVVIGVSPDSVKSHAGFRTKYGLPFSLLVDEGHKLADSYGVWVEKNLYGRKYMGIQRTTFLIAKDGSLAQVWAKVKVNGHVEEVLAAVKAL